MASFYNAIKGTTSGTPGTGAFTPNAASTGYRAWSTVPAGWWGLVRFEDGSAWALNYCYWNGTTLSRSSTQFVDSSTGSPLTLTSAATAALVVDGLDLPQFTNRVFEAVAQTGAGGVSSLGPAATAVGTAGGVGISTTSYFTEQNRVQYAAATTANAQCGLINNANMAITSTTAGRGGCGLISAWGPNLLPTGPRLFVGFSRTSLSGATTEPSAATHIVGFGQDSTDTNIQFMTNDGTGTATKVDTGIAMSAATSWFASWVIIDPGTGRATGLLVRLDAGAIWYGTATTDLPATGTMLGHLIGSLNGTNTGTAFQLHIQRMIVLTGTN